MAFAWEASTHFRETASDAAVPRIRSEPMVWWALLPAMIRDVPFCRVTEEPALPQLMAVEPPYLDVAFLHDQVAGVGPRQFQQPRTGFPDGAGSRDVIAEGKV